MTTNATNDYVRLATSGTVTRSDACPLCGTLMCFRVDAYDLKSILGAMCGNSRCGRFLVEDEW